MVPKKQIVCSGPHARYVNRSWFRVWTVEVEDAEGITVGRSYDCKTLATAEALAAKMGTSLQLPIQKIDRTREYESARRARR